MTCVQRLNEWTLVLRMAFGEPGNEYLGGLMAKVFGRISAQDYGCRPMEDVL